MNQIYQLTSILGRAQSLAAQVMMGDELDTILAEEVSGELSEFIEHLEGHSHHMDADAISPELKELADEIIRVLT